MEETDHTNLREFQVQASRNFDILSSVPATRLLHLQHFSSHGRKTFFIWSLFYFDFKMTSQLPFLQLFICSLAFGTFTVKLDLPQNRLQLSFILLLTTVTFKFVVSQTLPRISYLTYLVSQYSCVAEILIICFPSTLECVRQWSKK